jgi:mono/diheme cytochrome c family protein
MRRAGLVGVLVALVLGVAPLAGCRGEKGGGAAAAEEPEEEVKGAAAPGARPLPAGTTPKMAARGRKLFAETCTVCHGPDAAGTQLGPSLVDAEWLEGGGTVPEIERVIREGVPEPQEYPVPMPPLGGGSYTEEEVRALSAYVFSLGRQ